jgi:hypothetical protein
MDFREEPSSSALVHKGKKAKATRPWSALSQDLTWKTMGCAVTL